jgi:hypothetical protein
MDVPSQNGPSSRHEQAGYETFGGIACLLQDRPPPANLDGPVFAQSAHPLERAPIDP